jgi:hypothetical protein
MKENFTYGLTRGHQKRGACFAAALVTYSTKSALLFICLLATGMVAPVAFSQEDSSCMKLEDGRTLYGRSTLLPSLFGGWKVAFRDSLYYVLDVHSLRNSEGEFLRIEGSSRVAQLLFSGKINLYGKHRQDSLKAEAPRPFPLEPFCYFSKGGGLARIADYDNLRQDLGDNPVSLSHFDDYRSWEYVKVVSAGLSLAIFCSNFTESQIDQPLTAGSWISGLACAGACIISHVVQHQLLEAAIQEYNR